MGDDLNPKKENMNNSDDRNKSPNRRNGNGGPPGLPPIKFNRGGFTWLILLGLALAMIALLSKSYPKPTELSMDQFYAKLDKGEVKQLVLRDGSITGKLTTMTGQKEGSSPDFEVKFPQRTIESPEFVEDLLKKAEKNQISVKYETSDNVFVQVLLPLIPWLLIFGFIWFFVFRQLRSGAGGAGMLGNFGRSRHRMLTKEHTNITFDDVAGIDEAKDEVKEIIEFLKNPKKFQKLGGRIPRGVLLVGEPGCGKTMLAKAIAGEADVPFFSISGSDFVEMFVGVGASRVRDLFAQAKANAPCIIFLDEIDAVGRKRGVGFNGGGHDEREQTLNAILVEIDGFDSSDQVIVIAATNRADVLDPALTRPGRFDRQVYVPLPDIKGRYEILKVHAKKIRLNPKTDLWQLAKGTPMFSGADLAAIINEAAIAATMAEKDYVEMEDLEEARDKVRWGRAKKSRVIDENEKQVIAYHEAGHALASILVENADPVHKVSIIPRAQAGGMTMMLPEVDRHLYSKKYVLAMLQVSLGGRAAEDIACGDISSGASDDIKRTTNLAKTMVCDWGMSDLIGPIKLGNDNGTSWASEIAKDYSEDTSKLIDQEVNQLIRNAYSCVKGVLSEHRVQLDNLAAALLKYETLEADEVKRILNGETIQKTTVNDLLNNVAQQVSDSSSKSNPTPANCSPDAHQES
jgi:cell division protease FtsH